MNTGDDYTYYGAAAKRPCKKGRDGHERCDGRSIRAGRGEKWVVLSGGVSRTAKYVSHAVAKRNKDEWLKRRQ